MSRIFKHLPHPTWRVGPALETVARTLAEAVARPSGDGPASSFRLPSTHGLRRSIWGILLPFMVLPTLAACGSVPTHGQSGYARQAWETVVSVRIVDQYPHESVFTQGLIFADGYLCKSAGLFGESSVRKVQLGAYRT